MKKSSLDVVLTPVIDALIVIIMLIFMALLVFTINKAPVIEVLVPHKSKIKYDKPNLSLLKITDTDTHPDSLKINFSRNYDFIDTTFNNDTLILSIAPLISTEKKIYDFTISASDNEHTTKHRIIFQVIGDGDRDNNPPVINIITSWPNTIAQEKTEYVKLEIYDPDSDEIVINNEDLPDFIETSYNDDDGIMDLTISPTRQTNTDLHDYWIKVNDIHNAYDSLRIIFKIIDKKKLRDPNCAQNDAVIYLYIHALDENAIATRLEAFNKNKSFSGIKFSLLNQELYEKDYIENKDNELFLNVSEFKIFAENLKYLGESGFFVDIGKCKFTTVLFPYDIERQAIDKIQNILNNNFYTKTKYTTPLYKEHNTKKIKNIKKIIREDEKKPFWK